MRVIQQVAELRAALAGQNHAALVPTMGNLHQGHLSLVALAARRGAPVVVSIFVNRLQFGPNGDFDRYPRTLARDCAMLESAGCDVVFAPSESDLYPQPQRCLVQPPPALADALEGAHRPGFFVGVCTVVLKLFNIVRPQLAVFGKKDYQQLLILRDMVGQLALPIEIIAGETIRETSGLALSSRNSYLSPAELREAPRLYATLRRLAAGHDSAQSDWASLERDAAGALQAGGWKVDYVAVRRRDDLGSPGAGMPLVAMAAARLGSARLIDNVEFSP